jgi:hypothetical protein
MFGTIAFSCLHDPKSPKTIAARVAISFTQRVDSHIFQRTTIEDSSIETMCAQSNP